MIPDSVTLLYAAAAFVALTVGFILDRRETLRLERERRVNYRAAMDSAREMTRLYRGNVSRPPGYKLAGNSLVEAFRVPGAKVG